MFVRLAALLSTCATCAAACSAAPPALESCAQPLGGVWQDGDGRQYHLLDQGPTLELYPIFPSPPPPGASTTAGVYSALVYDFTRHPSDPELTGERSQWLTTPTGDRLRLKMPARIRSCRDQSLALLTGSESSDLSRLR